MKHYAERDLMTLGEYYIRHVNAMTAEELRSKSDIAAELAHRDMLIDKLAVSLEELRELVDLAMDRGAINDSSKLDKADDTLALLTAEPQPTKRFVSALERHDVWVSRQGAVGSGMLIKPKLYRGDPSTYTSDSDKWDSRELGASEEHVEVASPEEQAALERALSGAPADDTTPASE